MEARPIEYETPRAQEVRSPPVYSKASHFIAAIAVLGGVIGAAAPGPLNANYMITNALITAMMWMSVLGCVLGVIGILQDPKRFWTQIAPVICLLVAILLPMFMRA
jgi:hypothetical protein